MRLWADRKGPRTVEYPFLFENLPRAGSNPARILDVGCCESELVIELAKLGKYDVYGIDIRSYEKPLKYTEIPVHLVRGDIRTPVFPPDFFDVVLAISTVEHIGLNYYDNKWLDPDGDVAAMRQIFRILKPGGVAIVTVDAGAKGKPWFRAYDQDSVKRLTEGWTLLRHAWYEKRGRLTKPYEDVWLPCSAEQACSRPSKEYAAACVCMVLRKD